MLRERDQGANEQALGASSLGLLRLRCSMILAVVVS